MLSRSIILYYHCSICSNSILHWLPFTEVCNNFLGMSDFRFEISAIQLFCKATELIFSPNSELNLIIDLFDMCHNTLGPVVVCTQ